MHESMRDGALPRRERALELTNRTAISAVTIPYHTSEQGSPATPDGCSTVNTCIDPGLDSGDMVDMPVTMHHRTDQRRGYGAGECPRPAALRGRARDVRSKT